MFHHIFKIYCQLTKIGIVIFALLTACLSYALSLNFFIDFDFNIFINFFIGFYLVCSGGFILNQAQEHKLDAKMLRTAVRPIPSGHCSVLQAYILAFVFIILGLFLLFLLKPLTSGIALLNVILYNVAYTIWWKRHLKYAAVLGAIPGALPAIVGYSLGSDSIFNKDCIYLFVLLFLWQMPHFWSLAIRYKEDYKKAGIPVLPVLNTYEYTLYQMGFYMLAYLGLALISPLFLHTGMMYLVLLLPLVFILFYQFFKYFYNSSRWLNFFLWINTSILICFIVPVLDKWILYYLMSQVS